LTDEFSLGMAFGALCLGTGVLLSKLGRDKENDDMAMQKRDFRVIANALNDALKSTAPTGGTTRAGIEKAAEALADSFQERNEWTIEGDRRFDRERFMTAVREGARRR
jgi:hypothetical protein